MKKSRKIPSPPHIPARHRILHTLYHRGSAAQHWFSHRIRPAGAAALAAASFGAFLCIGQPLDSVFQIFCFALALLILALTYLPFRTAHLPTPHLRATHHLPTHATIGQPLHYTLTLENISGKNLHSLILTQLPADPRPTLHEFSSTPEPGENTRNIFDRTMIFYRWQWLIASRKPFTPTESTPLKHLPKAHSIRIPMAITPHRRGPLTLHHLRLLLPDPLGFFQKSIPIHTPRNQLIVLPQRYHLPPITMPGHTAFHIGRQETGKTTGTAGEFVSLRDYRPGDPPRLIHWKAYAHTGKPVVKELEDTYFPRYGLILDTFPSPQPPTTFEEMVSVAASFVLSLDHRDSLLDLIFITDKAHTLTSHRSHGGANTLLEVLSAVQQEKTPAFPALARTVTSHRTALTSCIVILNGYDTHRADLIASLVKSGIPCVPIAIGHGPPPPTFHGHWLRSGEIQRDLLRLPPTLIPAPST